MKGYLSSALDALWYESAASSPKNVHLMAATFPSPVPKLIIHASDHSFFVKHFFRSWTLAHACRGDGVATNLRLFVITILAYWYSIDSEMAGRHRCRPRSIQIIRTGIVKAADTKRPDVQQFHVSTGVDLSFLIVHLLV